MGNSQWILSFGLKTSICLVFLLLYLPSSSLVVVKQSSLIDDEDGPIGPRALGSKIQLHVPVGYLAANVVSRRPSYKYSPTTPSLSQKTEEEIYTSTTEETLPFFEEPYNITNVTTQLGQNVWLHCRVNDLRDKTVSWVRRKGESLHLITFGHLTYSNEARYVLDYLPPNDWRLLIRYANERDDGIYECQVSSHPPLVFYVYLTVIVPRVEIVDNRGVLIQDKFYKKGSTIELVCLISRVPQPSGYVQWRHGLRTLNYDTTRGGISVKTEMKPSGAESHLFIANANKLDSGNYSCSLDEAALTTISVHVLNGEHADAMQYGGSTPTHQSSLSVLSIIIPSLLRWLFHQVSDSYQGQKASPWTCRR